MVKVTAFSTDAGPSYTFTLGLLYSQYNTLVQSWIALQNANTVASQANAAAASNFTTVAVQVPTRFVTDLGSPFPVSDIASSISLATGLAPQSVFDITVFCCILLTNVTHLTYLQ